MDKIRTKSRQSKERNLCTQPLMAPFNPRGHVEGEEGVQKKKREWKRKGAQHTKRGDKNKQNDLLSTRWDEHQRYDSGTSWCYPVGQTVNKKIIKLMGGDSVTLELYFKAKREQRRFGHF